MKERIAVEQFKAYLQWMGEIDIDFFNFTEEKLNTFLATFWFNVRNSEGDFYKVKTLEGIRYSLNRALKDHGAKFDITSKSSMFQTSICAFEDAKTRVEKRGKRYCQSQTRNYTRRSVLYILTAAVFYTDRRQKC